MVHTSTRASVPVLIYEVLVGQRVDLLADMRLTDLTGHLHTECSCM